jgi:hypothetical protein
VTTATMVMDRALSLARVGTDEEAAVRDLLQCCGENRVSVVVARRRVLELDSEGDANAVRAAELLDQVLTRLSES